MFENEKCRFVTGDDYLANKDVFDKYKSSYFRSEYCHWDATKGKDLMIRIFRGMTDPAQVYYFLTKGPESAEEWAEILLAKDWTYYLCFDGGCWGYGGDFADFINEIDNGDIEKYVKRIMRKPNFIYSYVNYKGEQDWSNCKAPTGDYGKEIRKLIIKGLESKIILKKYGLTGVSEIKANIL